MVQMDLGFATIKGGLASAMSVIGTPEFMAPELYEERYTEKVDVYSYGLCVLELATLEYPYSECKNAAQIYKKVTSGVPPQALAKVDCEEMRNFISTCICPDPDQRPEARQLLKHTFFDCMRSSGGSVNSKSGLTVQLQDTVRLSRGSSPSGALTRSQSPALGRAAGPTGALLLPAGEAAAGPGLISSNSDGGVYIPQPGLTSGYIAGSVSTGGATLRRPSLLGGHHGSSAATSILSDVHSKQMLAGNLLTDHPATTPSLSPVNYSLTQVFAPGAIASAATATVPVSASALHSQLAALRGADRVQEVRNSHSLFSSSTLSSAPSSPRSPTFTNSSNHTHSAHPHPHLNGALNSQSSLSKSTAQQAVDIAAAAAGTPGPFVSSRASLEISHIKGGPPFTSLSMEPSNDGEASPYEKNTSLMTTENDRALRHAEGGGQQEGRREAEPDLDEADVLFDRLTVQTSSSPNTSPDHPSTARKLPSEQSEVREGVGMAIPTAPAIIGFQVGSFRRPTQVWPEEDPHTDENGFVRSSTAMEEAKEEEEVGSSLRPDLRRRLHLKCRNEGPSTLAFSLSFVNRGGLRKKVGFLYDLKKDEPMFIANEMVENLSLREDEAAFIAHMIQERVQNCYVTLSSEERPSVKADTPAGVEVVGRQVVSEPGLVEGLGSASGSDNREDVSDGRQTVEAFPEHCDAQPSSLEDTSASLNSWQPLQFAPQLPSSPSSHASAASVASISFQAPSHDSEDRVSSSAAGNMVVSRSSSSNSTVGVGVSSLSTALHAAQSAPERGIPDRDDAESSCATALGQDLSALRPIDKKPSTTPELAGLVALGPGGSLRIDRTSEQLESPLCTALVKTPVVFWEGEHEEEVPSCFF
ncbi:hypothetical protein CEUSTIGMA_g6229.t1 [Chlamydomonas eustigma]|uniref:non-specific serine/threonine protein kinase n=1 Tax=Chlamydomonas eustigma TaxID=1157962 RepID=A0A250X7C7_9CHLO|nr:hypothetical protein CEUSTIGMA_g6229.t1 [Chlamydomonas eustigma]|eukprot:GAX78792.1 hypothetical protein CEUSTIGMA_g6229.t1 [Chlamydomonas eustigma]